MEKCVETISERTIGTKSKGLESRLSRQLGPGREASVGVARVEAFGME
jgi:hypothetical protein